MESMKHDLKPVVLNTKHIKTSNAFIYGASDLENESSAVEYSV